MTAEGDAALLSTVQGRDTILMVRNKPVSVCARCGKYTTDLNATTCVERRADRGRCNGTFISAVRYDEWKHCISCSGSGTHDGSRCIPCQGTGWRFVSDGRDRWG